MKRYIVCALFVLAGCAGAQKPPASAPPPQESASAPIDLESANQTLAEVGVERIFELPDVDKGPSLGPKDAKVTLDVCSDFQCPFCARLVPTLRELEENYGGLLRVRWRNCPLPMHEDALPAAEAALEVYAQGGDSAFWKYHDLLFANQATLDTESLVKLAERVEGVDTQRVRAALSDHRHVPAVQADLRAVLDSGAASNGFGTPATFVNGRLISGAQPYEVFENAVEFALQESPEARAEALAKSRAAYPMITLRHILVQFQGARAADSNVTRTKDEARALATQVHQKLLSQPSTFTELVKSYSDDRSSSEDGLLGRFTRGELMPEIDNTVFALAPGEVSPVVETEFGFHVFQRTD